MKKQISVLLVVLLSVTMIISLSSCGGCGKKKSDTPPPPISPEQSTESGTPYNSDVKESTPEADLTTDKIYESTPQGESDVTEDADISSDTDISSSTAAEGNITPENTTSADITPESTPNGEITSESAAVSESTTESGAIATSGTVETPGITTEMDESAESTPVYVETVAPIEYETCNEDVYVFGTEEGLNLRSSDDFENDGNVVITIPNETKLQRIGYNETHKISIVIYNGEEYYCSSDYVTKELPASEILKLFEDVMEEAYVNPDGKWEGAANLYTAPDRTQHASHPITAKTKVFIIGIYYEDVELNGWSKVLVRNEEIKFEEFYMRNSVLTTTPPEN